MKLTASEFISKAEGLKSTELSLRQQLESLQSRHRSLESAIDYQEYRIASLEARMAALEAESDDEDGPDNSYEIAQIQAEIAAAYSEIREYEQEDAIVQSEIRDTNSELRDVEQEEKDTLRDIEDSATQTNQNMSIIASIGGDYANVTGTAAASFQRNVSQMAQAAQILGGSVSVGNFGGGGQAKSHSNSLATGASRNFYEAAAAQRSAMSKTTSPSPSGLGGSKASSPKSPLSITYENTMDNDQASSSPKKGGFGKKAMSSVKQSLSNVFGRTSEGSFSGFTAKKNPYQKDCWDIAGSCYDAYIDYYTHMGEYQTDSTGYGDGIIKEVDINTIEGISRISTAELNDPTLFWGRESGKTMQTFIEIAALIPEVKRKLQQGYRLDDLANDAQLAKCVSVYFNPDSPDAPTLYKGDGFYAFSTNGRHRILAARVLGYSFPMRIVGEVKKVNQSPAQKKARFAERIKMSNFVSHNTEQFMKQIDSAKNCADLAMLSQQNGIASNLDFGRTDLQVAQQMVKSLAKAKERFPNIKFELNFVGSIQARNDYVRRVASRELIKYYAGEYKKTHPNCSRDELKQYATDRTNSKLAMLSPRQSTIAQSVSCPSHGNLTEDDAIIIRAAAGITINESYGCSYSYFKKRKVEEVMSGHKPEGCNTPKATIDHEIGHQIANALKASIDPTIKAEFDRFMLQSRPEQAKTLSTYAGEDGKIGEFIAECWSEYQNNPECRDTARRVCERLFELHATINLNATANTSNSERGERIRER